MAEGTAHGGFSLALLVSTALDTGATVLQLCCKKISKNQEHFLLIGTFTSDMRVKVSVQFSSELNSQISLHQPS